MYPAKLLVTRKLAGDSSLRSEWHAPETAGCLRGMSFWAQRRISIPPPEQARDQPQACHSERKMPKPWAQRTRKNLQGATSIRDLLQILRCAQNDKSELAFSGKQLKFCRK